MVGSKITSTKHQSHHHHHQDHDNHNQAAGFHTNNNNISGTSCSSLSSSSSSTSSSSSSSPYTNRRKMISSSATSNLTRLAVGLVVLLALLEVTRAQNVHFSNGWYAGKKRSAFSSILSAAGVPRSPLVGAPATSSQSGPSAASVAAADGVFPACSVRPDIGDIIYKVVMEEMVRLHNSCRFGIPRDLRDILDNVSCKQTKW